MRTLRGGAARTFSVPSREDGGELTVRDLCCGISDSRIFEHVNISAGSGEIVGITSQGPRAVKHGLLEKTALWGRLGFNAQWNLRDTVRSKVRSVMAIAGVLGCTALLVCAFGMNDTMKDLKIWQYRDINRFQSKLVVEETASADQINEAIRRVKGEAVMETAAEIRANGVKKTGSLTATDHVTLLRATDENRRDITLPDHGVSLTYKMAGQLGVQKGDDIEWHIFGDERWVKTTVAEIYRDPSSQGIRLTREYLEELGYEFTATSILTPEKVSEKAPGIASIQQMDDLTRGWDDLTRGWDDLTEAMMIMVYVLIAAAAILALVLCILVNRMFSGRIRRLDMVGSLKAVE